MFSEIPQLNGFALNDNNAPTIDYEAHDLQ